MPRPLHPGVRARGVVRILEVLLAVCVAVPTAGAVYERVSAWRDARRFPAPGQLVDVGGRKLHIQCIGQGSPAVVFEAGGTHDSMQYSAIQREVAGRARACAYDRAGMGWSDPSPHLLDARSQTTSSACCAALVSPLPMCSSSVRRGASPWNSSRASTPNR